MIMDNIVMNEEKCCGCSACVFECPVECLSMKYNDEGFWYPTIDASRCIHCNRCDSVCPILTSSDRPSDYVYAEEAFAAIRKDKIERMNSSSGGIFSALAKYVIAAGGIVYGAAFDKGNNVVHIGIDNEKELWKLQGSKYVQSKIGNTYESVKENLETKKLVLFTGTPCQVAGLKTYLKRDYDNLICQDIICHGVPSPRVWKEYVRFREERAHSKVERIFFRNKKYGWKIYSILFKYSNNTEYGELMSLDLYMRLFLANLSLRPSCYECSFKGIKRNADITLADFWGVETVAPELFDNLGTSLVIIHSEKGKNIYSQIEQSIISKKVNLRQAISYNTAISESVPRPANRSEFFDYFINNGFDKNIDKFVHVGFLRRIKRKIIAEKFRKEIYDEDNCSTSGKTTFL